MADRTTYTPGKRLVLQVAMWLLLVATIGGAALLIHVKRGLWRVDLADAQAFGALEVRLPRNWQVAYDRRDGTDSVRAVEPASRRSITLRLSHPDAGGPMDFLTASGLQEYLSLDAEDMRLVEKIQVPDGEGIIIHPRRSRVSFAVLSFTDGRAVTVQLVNRGTSSGLDDAILYKVVTSIRLGSESPPAQRSLQPSAPAGNDDRDK